MPGKLNKRELVSRAKRLESGTLKEVETATMNEIAPSEIHPKFAEPGMAEKVLYNLPFVVVATFVAGVLAHSLFYP